MRSHRTPAGDAGPMPVKLTGRVGQDDREGRFNVEADLTNTKVENLMPGWMKAPGRQARLAFTLVRQKTGGLRLDDLLIDGQGVLTRPRCAPTAAPMARCGW